MARKFIELQEVAALLGISSDDLSDLRSRGDIYGYRDGTTWKFKIEEVQRVAADRGIQISEAALAGEVPLVGDDEASSSVDSELDSLSNVEGVDSDEGGESVLVTDVSLGVSPDKSSGSTVIGEKDDIAAESGSDLKLAPDPGETGSDLELVEGSGDGDDIKVASGDSMAAPGAPDAITLEGEETEAAATGSKVQGMSGDLNLDMASNADFVSGESLSLGESDLQLEESSDSSLEDSSSESASVDLALDDDDLVLGSGIGSDIALSAGDSGISLSSPSDTGLSLTNEPLELGGSATDPGFDLSEDIVPLDEEDALGSEESTQLGTDDDFLLTPVEETAGDESDSGSQVIALDSDESQDDAAATLFGTDSSVPITEAEQGLAAPGTAAVTAPTISPPSADAEAPYSIFQVLALAGILCFLALTGMFMYDLIRHMWSWDQPYTVNSRMMDWILGMMAGK